MRKIRDWTATIAALLAITAAVIIKAEITPLSFQESAATTRADWFAASRGSIPIELSGAAHSEGLNR